MHVKMHVETYHFCLTRQQDCAYHIWCLCAKPKNLTRAQECHLEHLGSWTSGIYIRMTHSFPLHIESSCEINAFFSTKDKLGLGQTTYFSWKFMVRYLRGGTIILIIFWLVQKCGRILILIKQFCIILSSLCCKGDGHTEAEWQCASRKI